MKKGIVIKTTGSNYIVRDEQGNQENRTRLFRRSGHFHYYSVAEGKL